MDVNRLRFFKYYYYCYYWNFKLNLSKYTNKLNKWTKMSWLFFRSSDYLLSLFLMPKSIFFSSKSTQIRCECMCVYVFCLLSFSLLCGNGGGEVYLNWKFHNIKLKHSIELRLLCQSNEFFSYMSVCLLIYWSDFIWFDRV